MRSIPNQPGLYRTANSYYFRKGIPSLAQNILGIIECKKSFKKDDYRTAKRKAAYLNNTLEQLFTMIGNTQPTTEEVKHLIRTFFEKLLMEAEGSIWLDTEAWREDYAIDAKERHDGKTPEERISQLAEELATLKAAAMRQAHLEKYRELAKKLMEWRGYEYMEMSPASTQLRKGMMEAEVEARRMELAMRNGDMHEIDIRHPLFKDCRNFLTDPDIDLLIDNEGLDAERMDALDGRITGFKDGANTRRNYGRAFTPADLYPDLCRISFNVDFSHLQDAN